MWHFSIRQIACNNRRICSLSLKRTAIQTAGCHTNLSDASIFLNLYLFRKSLSGIAGKMRISVIKNIISSVNALYASMICPSTGKPILLKSVLISHITIRNNNTSSSKTLVRIITDCIAQLMVNLIRIYKIIFPLILPKRTRRQF